MLVYETPDTLFFTAPDWPHKTEPALPVRRCSDASRWGRDFRGFYGKQLCHQYTALTAPSGIPLCYEHGGWFHNTGRVADLALDKTWLGCPVWQQMPDTDPSRMLPGHYYARQVRAVGPDKSEPLLLLRISALPEGAAVETHTVAALDGSLWISAMTPLSGKVTVKDVIEHLSTTHASH